MVDAATGGRAVFGRAIEKLYLGVTQGAFEYLNFDSVDLERIDDENASNAITGNEGDDQGTPADIKFNDKIKYSMTPSRILFDLVAMFGKPASATAVGGAPVDFASFALGNAGTGYTTGDPVVVTDAGGGTGAIVEVVAAAGLVTGINVMDPGSGYVTPILDFTAEGDGAATGTIGVGAASAWLVKIRPARSNEVRGASMYLYEGGEYTPSLQTGRRAAEISIADGANKRAEVSVTYSDPTGDTITGFAIGKSTNGAPTIGDNGLAVGTRGRRPYDANFDDGLSLYAKITALDGDKATMVAKFDDPSGATDGTNFGAAAYSVATFQVPFPSSTIDNDGYGIVVTDAGTVGLFGENFEAFEITLGAEDTDFAVGDEFEFPVAMQELTKTVTPESRLSAFHLIRKLGGSTDVRIDKGTTKITRPYKPYKANGRRIPQAIDPSGSSKVVFQFSKRLFDRFFRKKSDAHTRFSVYDAYTVESFIPGTHAKEKVEIFAPQMAVDALKSGNITSKDTLEESATLTAEQPNEMPTPPTGFDASLAYPMQFNITTRINPTWLL